MSKNKIPRFKILASTKAHGSLDVHICRLVAERIKNKGFNSKYLGYFSFEELKNGDIYILKHERRGAWKYVFTASQGDAEAIIMNRDVGNYPSRTKGQVTGHKHTSEGTLMFKGVDIINVPSWVLWFPYPQARAMMHYYQPDIGAYILIVTKDGRTHWQEWLYKPFIYNEVEDQIIENTNPRRGYANPETFTVSPQFRKLLENSMQTIIVISDTHTGELEAPCPEEFPLYDTEDGYKNGRLYKPSLSIANKRLNAYWYHFVYMSKFMFKPDEIWHLGDPVAGTNPFERYRNPLMTNLEIEADACAELVNAFNYSRKRLKKLVNKNLV